ncbi:MAG: TrmB family transcriptional regulator, partial [Staphylothermus sp.]|nr:TrmB family transcriptional regulator [Staphylothermus sp.]
MREELINKLKELGLTTYEAKAYVALVVRGEATASEICDLSGIPYTRIYDVLASLVNKGMVVSIPRRPMKYKAIDPRRVLENLRENIVNEYKRKIETIERIMQELLSELVPLYEKRSQNLRESILFLRGRRTINDMIMSLYENSRERIVCVMTYNTLTRLIRYRPRIQRLLNSKEHYVKIFIPREAINEIPSSLSSKTEVTEEHIGQLNICVIDE